MLFQIKAIIVPLIAIISIGPVTNGCLIPYELIGNWAISPSSVSVTNSSCCVPTAELTIGLDSNGNITLAAESWEGSGCNAVISNSMLNFSASLPNVSIIDGWNSGICCTTSDNCYQFMGLMSPDGGIVWSIEQIDPDYGDEGCYVDYYPQSSQVQNVRISLLIVLVIAYIFM